jgi:hypothetical protein
MFGRPKKLKKIPSNLLSYIQIEGEAIKDANDKQMISSYAHNKLDMIDWYIQVLKSGSNKYVVPHSLEHLQDLRERLQTVINGVLARPIPKGGRPLMDIKYPEGYEG